MIATNAANTVSPNVDRDLAKLREVTGKVVGSVFFGSMLKMMRDSKIKGTIGHGGRGEEVFSGQLHGILAERMGERGHGGIVDTLYKQLERQQKLISGRRIDFTGQNALSNVPGSFDGSVNR